MGCENQDIEKISLLFHFRNSIHHKTRLNSGRFAYNTAQKAALLHVCKESNCICLQFTETRKLTLYIHGLVRSYRRQLSEFTTPNNRRIGFNIQFIFTTPPRGDFAKRI